MEDIKEENEEHTGSVDVQQVTTPEEARQRLSSLRQGAAARASGLGVNSKARGSSLGASRFAMPTGEEGEDVPRITRKTAYVRSLRRSYPATVTESRYRYVDMFSMLRATQLENFRVKVDLRTEGETEPGVVTPQDGRVNGDALVSRVKELDKAFSQPYVMVTPEELKRLQAGAQAAAAAAASGSTPAPAPATPAGANGKPDAASAPPKKFPLYVHWEAIKDDKISKPGAKQTIWWAPEYAREKEQQSFAIKDLDKLFPRVDAAKIAEKKQAAAAAAAAANSNVVRSVLEARRATTINLVMRKLGIKTAKFAKLAWSFRDMDEKFFTREAVEMFEQNAVWPTAEELKLLKGRVEIGAELAEPDQMLWFIATTVPDVAARICAMGFRYDFEESFEEMIAACSTIEVAAKELMTSKLLKQFFRILLFVINKINEQSLPTSMLAPSATAAVPVPKGSKAPINLVATSNVNNFASSIAAKGITLDSLFRTCLLRTPGDKSVRVLDIIVRYLKENFPDLLDISSYLMCTPSAAKYDLQEQDTFLNEAKKGLDKIRVIPKMDTYVLQATKRLHTIEKNLARAGECFRDALEYFGYERNAMGTGEFFYIVKTFLEYFDKAVEKMNEIDEGLANAEETRDDFNSAPIRRGVSTASMRISRKSVFGFIGGGGGGAGSRMSRKSIFSRR